MSILQQLPYATRTRESRPHVFLSHILVRHTAVGFSFSLQTFSLSFGKLFIWKVVARVQIEDQVKTS